MNWQVVFHDAFEPEFLALASSVQDELLAHALLLRDYGPGLGRPTVDTLKGSKHANMKELRFRQGKEVWRASRLTQHLAELNQTPKEKQHGKKT